MTATRLQVEVTDFVVASRMVYDEVGDPVRVAFGRLCAELSGLSAMAGDDPGGQAWAGSYDRAAGSALHASQRVVNAAYRLSSMFARSGLNYAEADSASTASAQRAISGQLQDLPPETSIGPAPALPSAAGGGGNTPTGWGLVAHAVGYLWPNGHQDRLHRAAEAWTASAQALEDATIPAWVAVLGFARDRLPEADDMITVCRGLSERLAEVADAHRSLARACTDLAGHIDSCHAAVIDELRSLLEWSAGIQTVGAVVSAFSFGTAEAPTQAAQLAKITAAAARVRGLIETFLVAARGLAETIPSVATIADRVSISLDRLANSRLAIASMNTVPNLPHALGAARLASVAKSPELAATERLASEADSLVKKPGIPETGRAKTGRSRRVGRQPHSPRSLRQTRAGR